MLIFENLGNNIATKTGVPIPVEEISAATGIAIKYVNLSDIILIILMFEIINIAIAITTAEITIASIELSIFLTNRMPQEVPIIAAIPNGIIV